MCSYWPEFAQCGKETTTVRQLLAHQAGLFAFDEPVDRHAVADLDRLAIIMARRTPAWKPGERQAYHAITIGFYESELLRRIDPKHRTLGQFFQDEIASPLDLEFYIRLPEEIPNSRLATIKNATPFEMFLGFPIRLTLATLYPRSHIYRARGAWREVWKSVLWPHARYRLGRRNSTLPCRSLSRLRRSINPEPRQDQWSAKVS